MLPPVPAGTSCESFAKIQVSSHFAKCEADYQAEKWPRIRPANFDSRSCAPDNKADECLLDGYNLIIQWSERCKVPTIHVDSHGWFKHCHQTVTPNRAKMDQLISTVKTFCKNQAGQIPKSDTCSAFWVETECFLDFAGLRNKTYQLEGNKSFTPSFEISDPPCERKLTLPEVPSGKKCVAFGQQHISRHNHRCFQRFQQRVSSKNCLANDEWSDCNMDMGTLFMKWSKKCKVPISQFSGWSLGFQACPTASKSVTPNIQKVTQIANKAKQFCKTQAGTGTKCQLESKTNTCLRTFTYLERRVYQLKDNKTFQYKLKFLESPKCVDKSKNCVEKIRK